MGGLALSKVILLGWPSGLAYKRVWKTSTSAGQIGLSSPKLDNKKRPADDPCMKLLVEGKEVFFLVDTGATQSTLKKQEVLGVPTTGQTARVIGAAGTPYMLQATVLLKQKRRPEEPSRPPSARAGLQGLKITGTGGKADGAQAVEAALLQEDELKVVMRSQKPGR
ncbi:hypothetical protein GN956_G12844 [Arapaima gigas]